MRTQCADPSALTKGLRPVVVRRHQIHRALGCIILLASTCFAQVIVRPTSDADAGATTAIGCSGSVLASTAMPLGYDGAGISTSNTQATTGDTVSQRYRTRIFGGFTSSGASYNTLSLNVYVSSSGWKSFGSLNGNACAAYSLDNGVTWTSLVCDGSGPTAGAGFGPQLYTATLSTTQNIAQVKVGVCTQGQKQVQNGGSLFIGEDNISVFDMYLQGTTTPTSGGNGSSAGNGARGVVVSN